MKELPFSFWRQHLPERESHQIVLTSYRRHYSMKVTQFDDDLLILHSGWRIFYDENGLEIGSIVTFMLLPDPYITFKVTIEP